MTRKVDDFSYSTSCCKMMAVATLLGTALTAESTPPSSQATTMPVNSLPATNAETPSTIQPRPGLLAARAPELVAAPAASGGEDQLDEIFYLPVIKVTTAKLPPDSIFVFLTAKGRLELAIKSSPGLRIGPLAALNNSVAMELQKEAREYYKRSAMTERVLTIAVGDGTKAKELIRFMRDAKARLNTDWQTRNPGSK